MITEQVSLHASPAITRLRLAVIGVVAVLAAGIGLVLGSVLVSSGGAQLARSADYVPRDAIMYLEIRLDLPGDQRAHLQAILDRFPAVEADDLLGEALAGTLDQALADGDAPFDYSTDIAPWFDGSLAMALLDYPVNPDPMQMELPHMVGMFGVRDAAGAERLAGTLRGEMELQGAIFDETVHGGVTIRATTVHGMAFAHAVTDDQLILANSADAIRAALDAQSGGDRLADEAEIGRLLAGLPDERIGVAVVNSEAMLASTHQALETAAPSLADAVQAYLDAVPPLSVGAVSLAADAVLFDGISTLPSGPLAPENADRHLAESVPAGALVYLDGGKVGASLEQLVTSVKASLASAPDGAEQLAGVAQVEAALDADLEELVSWIGSGALAAGWDGDEAYAGLVLEANDPASAERRLAQLRALAELATMDPSSGVEVTTAIVGGVEVTTLRLSSPDGSTFAAPFDMAVEYAIHDGVVLIGFGDRFVRTALDLEPSASLARSERFGAAVARFGGNANTGVAYVDLAGLRSAVEAALGDELEPMYGSVRPNLEPFDYLAAVTRVEGDRLVTRSGLVLR